MRFYFKIILFICALGPGFDALAQSDNSVAGLIKQGVELNNQKKYTEAADSYKAALTLEPENVQANYQMAFTLFSAGKNTEALPFIEKATTGTNAKFTAAAYSLMGSIYQGTGQLPNAVAAYQNAIKADPGNQRIYYNLGIAYFKAKQYGEAEYTFANAMALDSSDAGSTRMYALSAFHQNKRAEATFGFCRFLMLEPATTRSAEAYGNLQNILEGGVLKPEPGYRASRLVSSADPGNKILTKALAGLANRKYATPADLMAAQLKAIFNSIGDIPVEKYAFWQSSATYFKALASTDNMPAFARYISQRAKPESVKWLKNNPDKLSALQSWMATHKPKFL
ncbi:tetratricopeptide repeat protein [Mucilaginibacter sp. ZT4R22]|uniref:Tetratricopeptide repeat protein n=1 Tax=Mucilaginibacter pankratovii TaxID=2772110 RepID=A0ABR7WR54_9SPHI|nr:tetratricopeptide repeat protein [Mucilaginibacter pankratovii]MBD1364701.1 tetratricopeptide repeat protein [Mucilaginibacter pankratovii]